MNIDYEQLQALAGPKQPPPTPGDGDVWAELIERVPPGRIRALCEERRAEGIRRYGCPLHRQDGRDHFVDAIQEMLDGAVYFEAAGMEKVADMCLVVIAVAMEGRR